MTKYVLIFRMVEAHAVVPLVSSRQPQFQLTVVVRPHPLTFSWWTALVVVAVVSVEGNPVIVVAQSPGPLSTIPNPSWFIEVTRVSLQNWRGRKTSSSSALGWIDKCDSGTYLGANVSVLSATTIPSQLLSFIPRCVWILPFFSLNFWSV